MTGHKETTTYGITSQTQRWTTSSIPEVLVLSLPGSACLVPSQALSPFSANVNTTALLTANLIPYPSLFLNFVLIGIIQYELFSLRLFFSCLRDLTSYFMYQSLVCFHRYEVFL